MKIEKINDNQIRCTLTRTDLADRELKLSELVCGTEKAKSLFQDMMQQASVEFGFEAENIPLMIEAIPASPDSVVLIITKVDDPEELDSKLAKTGPIKQPILDKVEAKPIGVRLFSFANMDCVIHACHLLFRMFDGSSTLYKESSENIFFLTISGADLSTGEFNKICNMLSEYGSPEKFSFATLAYLEEHCETIVSANAVQQLGSI